MPQFDVAAARAAGVPQEKIDAYLKAHPEVTPMVGDGKSPPQTPQADPQDQPVSNTRGILAKVENGLTAGYNDEFASGIDSLVDKIRGRDEPLTDLYQQHVGARQQELNQYGQEHPNISALAEGAGATVPSIAAMMVGQPEAAPLMQQADAPGIMSRVADSMKAGGAIGAAAGYGNSQGDNQNEDTLIGTLFGAGSAGLLHGGAELGGKIVGPLKRMGALIKNLFGEDAPTKIGPGASSTAIPAVNTPEQATAATSYGKAPQIEDAPAQSPAPGAVAADRILTAMQRDQQTPASLIDQITREKILGKPTPLGAVGGENLQGLARSVYTAPGPGKQIAAQAMNSRADGQVGRVLGDVAQGLGPITNSDAAIAQIGKAKSEQNRINYQQAVDNGPALNDPDLNDTMNGHEGYQRAHEGARKMFAQAGEDIPALYDESGKLVRPPNVRDIDLIKRGMDRILYNDKRGITDPGMRAMDKGFRSAYMGTRESLLGQVDQLAPDYAKARQYHANETEKQEAIEFGQNVLDMSSREVEDQFNKFTPAQQDLARQGAADALRQRVMGAADNAERANVVKSIFGYGKGEKAAAIRPLFPTQESFDTFKQQMLSEHNMSGFRNKIMGGSQTANKLSELSDEDEAMQNVAEAGVKVARGHTGITDLLIHGIKAGYTRASMPEAARQEMATRLFDDSADKSVEFLKFLEDVRQKRLEKMRNTRSVLYGVDAAALDRDRHSESE